MIDMMELLRKRHEKVKYDKRFEFDGQRQARIVEKTLKD